MSVYELLSFVSFLLFFQGVIFTLYHLAPSRQRTAFILVAVAFAIFAFFTFLQYTTNEIAQIYVIDRLASLGWATFPVLIVWLVYFLWNSESKFFEILLTFLLTPLALVFLFRYNYEPESVKIFYNLEGIWYYSVNLDAPWFYLFVAYLFLCVIVCLALLQKAWKKSISKRQSKQLRSISLGLIAFVLISIITNLAFPFFGIPLVPPMAHINSLFLGFGFFYAVVVYRQPALTSEVLSQFVNKHVQDFVFYFDQGGTLFAVNKKCIDQLQYNTYEILRLQPEKLFGDYPSIQRLTAELQSKTKSTEASMDLHPRNGSPIPVKFLAHRISDNFGIFVGMVLIGFDQRLNVLLKREITDRIRNEGRLKRTALNLEEIIEQRTWQFKLANEQLQLEVVEKSRAEEQISIDLEEKLKLLQEIHHRVKNNFQIVISLARMLESHEELNENYRLRLRRFSEKVRWISSIHEYFYGTQKLTKINFSEFLKKSTGELYASLGAGKRIIFRLNVGEVLLDIDQALSCGIVFHELLSNAIHYAFVFEDAPAKSNLRLNVVVVEFFELDHHFILIVSDNGVGLPGFSQLRRKEYSGLKLTKLLALRHLSGKLTINSDSGITCKLTFPKIIGITEA